MEYYSLNQYLKDTYGRKLYKISIDGGFSCPNRDGKIGTGGCIFCLDGSGAFAGEAKEGITEQIERGKTLVEKKLGKSNNQEEDNCPKYIAYFQAYTGTYAPIEKLRSLYMEAVNHPDIAIISIATRPDCLEGDVLGLLEEINQIKPVWIELGLQTIHKETTDLIRRGYELPTYDLAVRKLKDIDIKIITHVIIGLPGETSEDIYETVKYVVNSGVWGIKLQLLHVLNGTVLAQMYEKGKIEILSIEKYADIVVECLRIIPETMVVHRITGDGDKKNLIAPLWSGDKKRVLNYLNRVIKQAMR